MNHWPTLRTLAKTAIFIPWGVSAAVAADQGTDCRSWPTASAELRAVLGKQAVSAASASVRASVNDQLKLTALIAPWATFDLGSGDVEQPLGRGLGGFRRLIDKLQADRYRFDGWDYMENKEAPCGTHEVTVEFTSAKKAYRTEVTFKFVSGRIAQGKAWQRSITAGGFPTPSAGR